MNLFSEYIQSLKAEWLKLKGSGIFWLVVIMSAFIPVILILVKLLAPDNGIPSSDTINPWKEFIVQTFNGFGGFFFPIFLTLVVVRLTQMEHRGGGWKLIETQPVTKTSLYLGKFSTAVLVAFFCIIALVAFSLMGATLIMLVKSSSLYSKNPIPAGFILGLSLRLLISGLGILAIQYFFSVVINGFLGPFAIGLGATITGSILLGFDTALWWPYAAPALTVRNYEGSTSRNFLFYYEWLSIGWMLLALWLGYQWYQRRTFKRAYFKPITRLVYWVFPAGIFVAFFIYITRPTIIPSYNKTVIAGTIQSKDTVERIYFFSGPYFDTVMSVPVEKNRFHFVVDKKIPASEYYFVAGKIPLQKIFFGTGDSLYIELKSENNNVRISARGNRLAENEYIKKESSVFDILAYQMLEKSGYEMKPDVFALALMRAWRNEIRRMNKFKTSENIKPADDFIELQKKLISIRYLKLLDTKYPQWFRVYHPNDTLKFPEAVNLIKKTLSYNDSNLLVYPQYGEIITEHYQYTYKLKLSDDPAYINKTLTILSPGPVRDYLIYNRMKDAIGKMRDTLKRELFLLQYLPAISQPGIQQRLVAQHFLIKSLNRGKPAPDFQAYALNRDTVSLEDFKGRYMVIDVWATWCAPCKTESPYFEKFAEQFTSPNIAFVALSTDDRQEFWRFEAVEKSSKVMQLIAKDKNAFAFSYGIEYIPRFILIGPDGNILNAQLPAPSEAEFEDILRKEIPGLGIF